MVARKFGTLDLLRAIASVIVVFVHVSPLRGRMFPLGGLSVDLFFLISGFVIASAYEHKLAGAMGFGRFASVRLIRLYPMYFLGTAIGVAAFVCGTERGGFALWKMKSGVAPILFALFLLPFPAGRGIGVFRFNGPAWSLFFELAANALHALVLRRLSSTWLLGLTLASGLGVLAVQALTGRGGYGDVGWEMILAVPDVLFPYGTGMLLHRLWRSGDLPKLHLSALPIAAAFVAVTIIPGSGAELLVAGDLARFLLFPLLVAAAIQVEPQGLLVAVARMGERLSYPLYMLHVPLIIWAETGMACGWWSRGGGGLRSCRHRRHSPRNGVGADRRRVGARLADQPGGRVAPGPRYARPGERRTGLTCGRRPRTRSWDMDVREASPPPHITGAADDATHPAAALRARAPRRRKR